MGCLCYLLHERENGRTSSAVDESIPWALVLSVQSHDDPTPSHNKRHRSCSEHSLREQEEACFAKRSCLSSEPAQRAVCNDHTRMTDHRISMSDQQHSSRKSDDWRETPRIVRPTKAIERKAEEWEIALDYAYALYCIYLRGFACSPRAKLSTLLQPLYMLPSTGITSRYPTIYDSYWNGSYVLVLFSFSRTDLFDLISPSALIASASFRSHGWC
jgi:hypothetical protein